MSGLTASRAEMERFDALCHAVNARGPGITLRQIGTCDALARELESDAPDRTRITELAARLGLDLEALS